MGCIYSVATPDVLILQEDRVCAPHAYIVLEYVPGGTLEERLRDKKPLPDDETFAIAAGVAAGLAHAHARGVVHRDLKPANVLFDEDGRPKLADFGIARMAAGEGTLTEAKTSRAARPAKPTNVTRRTGRHDPPKKPHSSFPGAFRTPGSRPTHAAPKKRKSLGAVYAGDDLPFFNGCDDRSRLDFAAKLAQPSARAESSRVQAQ